jgi:ATP/maltotriose-dependent transcriptional regulator MalT
MYWRSAVERAEHAGNRFVNEVLGWMLLGAWWGHTTTPEVGRLADEALARGSSKRLEAYALVVGGGAIGAAGRLDEGREKIAAGRALLRDLGDLMSWGGISVIDAELELAAERPQRAYETLAAGAEVLAARSETGYLATVVSLQAHAALELGREAEAARLAHEALGLASRDDFDPRTRSSLVLARIAAARGDADGADRLLAHADELVEPTDFIALHFDAALARAEVSRHTGRAAEARAALEHALELAGRKENVLAAAQARARLDALAG